MDLPCIVENYKTLDKKALTKQEISVRYWMCVCLCVHVHMYVYSMCLFAYVLLEKCVLSSVCTFVRPYVFSLTCEMFILINGQRYFVLYLPNKSLCYCCSDHRSVCVGAGAYKCLRRNSAYEILVGAMTKENCKLADKTTKYVHAPRAWFNYHNSKTKKAC